MIRKNVQCDNFVYFGVYVSIGELTAAMHRFRQHDDIYAFVYGAKLEYRRVGNAGTSAELVVGVQLDAELAYTAFKVVTDVNGQCSLARRDGTPLRTSLPPAEETEVRRRLTSIGLLKKPEYYVFHSYQVRGEG